MYKPHHTTHRQHWGALGGGLYHLILPTVCVVFRYVAHSLCLVWCFDNCRMPGIPCVHSDLRVCVRCIPSSNYYSISLFPSHGGHRTSISSSTMPSWRHAVTCGDTQVESGDLRKTLGQLQRRDQSGITDMEIQFSVSRRTTWHTSHYFQGHSRHVIHLSFGKDLYYAQICFRAFALHGMFSGVYWLKKEEKKGKVYE